jgi:hypothetical protein
MMPENNPKIDRLEKNPNWPPPVNPWEPPIMPFIQPPKPPQPGPLVPNHAKPTMLVMKTITPPIRDKIKEVVSP